MKAALYARVSKGEDQNPENQLKILREWAQRTGATIIGEFVDRMTTRDTRPKKEEVLRLARTLQIDAIVFVALDRWGRDMSELVYEMNELPALGVSLISIKEGLNFNDSVGRLNANLLAAFASFERDRISERTKWGLERARNQGKRLGRHPKNCDCPKHIAATRARAEERQRIRGQPSGGDFLHDQPKT